MATVPNRMFATTEQVADFYEVDRDIVLWLAASHRDEFKAAGYRVVSGPELRILKADLADQGPFFKGAKAIATWDRRAVLLLGMLLRDSPVAKAVRR